MSEAQGVLFEPLPWLDTHWHRLWQTRCDGRLGHALLLTGPAGLGKRRFADLFAAALMCHQPCDDGVPCGRCPDCELMRVGTHPDLVRLAPEAESKSGEIKVDAVRELCSRQTLTTNRGPVSVLQIAPAEAMNAFAANSLLKTLEEPVASTLLLLISEDPARLPATVISRCQRITMLPPPADTAVAWLSARVPAKGLDLGLLLRLAHGAPLRALALADGAWLAKREQGFRQFRAIAEGREDPLAGADAWQQLDPALVLDWLASWISDLLRIAQAGASAQLSNPDKCAELADLAQRLTPRSAHRYLQQILRSKSLAASSINRQLLFESLLVQWAQLARGAH